VPCGRAIVVTFFSSFGATKKREIETTIDALAPRIRAAGALTKGALPWLKLARFGDHRTEKNSLRNNDNVVFVSGIEADYDHGITTVDDALTILRNARICAMVYTSPSHSEDEHRWRVLCPLSVDHAPADRFNLLARLNGLFQGSLSGESFTLSQSYYFGRVKDNPSHRVDLVEGDYLDLRVDLDEGAIGKPVAEYQPPETVVARQPSADRYIEAVVRNALAKVSGASDGQKHDTLRNQAILLGGYAVLGGYSANDAVEWLMQALPSNAKDRKAARVTAAWGIERGLAKPLSVPERLTPPAQRSNPPPEPAPDPVSEPVITGNVVALRPPERIPTWRDAWHRTETGSPLPNLYNALVAMRQHAPLTDLLRYDEMSLTTILHREMPAMPDCTIPRPIRDKDVIALQEVMQGLGLRRIARGTVQDAVDLIAAENSFHPVRQYLDGLEWDGVQRVRGWLGKYLGVQGDKYPDEIGQLFLIAMVARIYRPGCQADYVLVLEGPQGALKSSACRALAGDWFSDGLPDITHADPIRLSMHLRGKWLIEIAELASLHASEVETIKAFATRTHETYTPKYARNEVVEPRQCLFIASTNQSEYLHDETGGRRFWPVAVGKIDLDGLRLVRDQLFAEAVELYRDGARWWPEREFEAAHIAPQQAERYEEDAWADAIEDWLARQLGYEFTVTEVAMGSIGLPLARIRTHEQRRVRKVLIRLKWKQTPGRSKGRKWIRPEITAGDADGVNEDAF